MKKSRGRTGFDVLLILTSACRVLLETRKRTDKLINAETNTAGVSFLGTLFAMFAGMFTLLRRREDDYSSPSFV